MAWGGRGDQTWELWGQETEEMRKDSKVGTRKGDWLGKKR